MAIQSHVPCWRGAGRIETIRKTMVRFTIPCTHHNTAFLIRHKHVAIYCSRDRTELELGI